MWTINDNYMTYGSWDMEHDRQDFFVILDHFLHFYPSNNPKNQDFEKMKNPTGDIIIWHRCTINDNHMMYGSWDMERDEQNFWDMVHNKYKCYFSFWTIFCPFTSLLPFILWTKSLKNTCEGILFSVYHTPGCDCS